jgi:hypothetical protein
LKWKRVSVRAGPRSDWRHGATRGNVQKKNPHQRESNEGANALVEVEKVLPRGMKEGVACLQRFSSETDGLPGLELGKRVCLRGFRRALNRYSITSHL